jgi:hypothetical protein
MRTRQHNVGPMRPVIVILTLTLLSACTTDRPANCVVTPANLVECNAN